MSRTIKDAPRIFKTKAFSRFARKARIADEDLMESARSIDRGVVDADLGGGVFKQRIARAGQGKSGGSRVIVLFRHQDRLVYVFGFEKKDRANIGAEELAAFRELADVILGYSDAEIAKRVEDGALIEVPTATRSGNGN